MRSLRLYVQRFGRQIVAESKRDAIGFLLLLLILVGVAAGDFQTYRVAGQIASLVKSENPMSTTYIDMDGLQHTVNTPNAGAETAANHRIDLKNAFCQFEPREHPSWWTPADCN